MNKSPGSQQPAPRPPSIHVTPHRRRVVFRGQVQGVSFRAKARELAAGRPLTGFVRNLPDGTVELEAQGDAAAIDAFLAAIAGRFEGNIEYTDACGVPPVNSERGFEIRR